MQRAARRLALASFRSSYTSCSSSPCGPSCLADNSSTSILMSRMPALMRPPGACRLHACSSLGHQPTRWLTRPAAVGRAAFSSWPKADRSSHQGHQHSSSSGRGSSSGPFSSCSTPGRHPRMVCGAQGHTHDDHSTCSCSGAEQHPHDHHHHHDHDHSHSSSSSSSSSSHQHPAGSNGHIHGAVGSHHDHHHHHHHPHHHHHHHHFHTDSSSGGPQNPFLVALDRLGLFRLADHLEHHTAYTITAVASFAASLALQQAGAAGLLAASVAAPLSTAALVVPFLLLGAPQLAETLVAFAARQVDTHVLMSLSIVGTLYMGMAQEAALLLLLFRVSHLMEDKLTAAASGSLERLFDAVPSTATLVEVEEGGAPRTATAHQVAATSVSLGSHVLVRPGEQVPLDGAVVWGASNVSMQHISGESLPVKVEPGAEVPAGSLSMDGLLVLRVTASSEDSTPARMARMAAQAQAERPQLTRWLDQVGGVWSKTVIGATLATMVILPFLGVPFWGDRGALYRAMGVLTAGSPCALALVPLAYACAIAVITMRGMLVKSGAALDALHACKVVALDKTGTLTTGALTLSDGFMLDLGNGSHSATTSSSSSSQTAASVAERITISPMPAASSWLGHASNSGSSSSSWALLGASPSDGKFHADAVKCAVALSRLSNHPVSRALVEAGQAADADVSVLSFEQVPGAGVQGVCQIGDEPAVMVRFGALDWVASFLPEAALVTDALHMRTGDQHDKPSRAVAFITMSDVAATPDQQQQQQPGQPGSQLSMLCFEDVIQAGVPAAVQQLQSGGWCSSWLQPAASSKKSVVMLTGDNPRVAAAVAAAVGIQQYKASLRPQDKLEYVKDATAAAGGSSGSSSKEQGGLVMAGDGINDAPALAASTVGVAIARSPTDMVASAADIIILNGQGVTNLPWLFHVAERTDTILKQNLALALLSVVVATLPTLAGLFPLWLAVTLHEGSTLLVALNSLRLLLESRSSGAPPSASSQAAANSSSSGKGRGGSGGAAAGSGSGSGSGGAAGDAAPVFAVQGGESGGGACGGCCSGGGCVG